MMEIETLSCIPKTTAIHPLASTPRSSTPITKIPNIGFSSPQGSIPSSSESTEESSPNTSTAGTVSPVNFASESRGNHIPFSQTSTCMPSPLNCHTLPHFESAKMILDASNHNEQMDVSSEADCTSEKEKIAIAAITDLARSPQNGVLKIDSRSFPAVPEMSPTTSGDGDTDRISSPASSEPTQEKQRSRRKPSLEDIVRRMRPTDDCYYTDEDSDDEEYNRSLSIDMARRSDEVDGDVSMTTHHHQHERKDIPHHTKTMFSESVKSEKGHSNVNDLSDSKENLPAFPNGSLPPSFPLASNISETAFSPGFINNKHWFNGSINGLPMFPFPPSQMDPSMVHKFLPFDNKMAAEVEKDYLKCQYCERTFRRQKNLENHIENTHHGKSPVRRKTENGTPNDMYFKCTHCPYTTKHQSNLYVHIRIHTGERPYICGACGVQYSQSHSLKSHIINKHDGIMSYYIKEKRTRSPRGMGYLASTGNDNSMFKLPPPLLPHGIPGLPHNFDMKSLEMMRNTEQMMSQHSPQFSVKLPFLNGHASPNYGDVPANRSPGSFQMPANAQMPNTPIPSLPTYQPTSSPAPLTPNHSMNTKKESDKDECGAIDLSKKNEPLEFKHNIASLKEKHVLNVDHTHALCANCLYAPKLKMLRLNVVKMLSILVPNLNFEEKGISADSDSVDELLQDVIESNTHEEDMTAE